MNQHDTQSFLTVLDRLAHIGRAIRHKDADALQPGKPMPADAHDMAHKRAKVEMKNVKAA